MANEEHLKILKYGVDVWNSWRRRNADVQPDLSRARLCGCCLSEVDLNHADLSRADLSEADLSKADLLLADLSRVDLSRANLSGADLRGADLRGGHLREASLTKARLDRASLDEMRDEILIREAHGHLLRETNLGGADLCGSRLYAANLRDAILTEANLTRVDLWGADLRAANLTGADLTGADLAESDLQGANIARVNLSGAKLGFVDLRYAEFTGSEFHSAQFGYTVLGGSDLRDTKGLESIYHSSPSLLGVDVLQKAQGQLPDAFLKGCGLSDWEIEAAKLHNPNLTEDERTAITYEILRIQGQQPIQLNPLFISYSSRDAPFVDKLAQQLDERGIRFWRGDKDLKAGRLETQIDRAIRLNPTVLLVLSEGSVESDWVEWEVGQARKLEKELKRDVLCPVALDDKWKTCDWEERLRNQIKKYHVLDFSAWEEGSSFEGQFGKLLEGLKLFYRGEER